MEPKDTKKTKLTLNRDSMDKILKVPGVTGISLLSHKEKTVTIYTDSEYSHKFIELALDDIEMDGHDFEFLVTGTFRKQIVRSK